MIHIKQLSTQGLARMCLKAKYIFINGVHAYPIDYFTLCNDIKQGKQLVYKLIADEEVGGLFIWTRY